MKGGYLMKKWQAPELLELDVTLTEVNNGNDGTKDNGIGNQPGNGNGGNGNHYGWVS
jgi:hypothetical protein